MFLINCFLDSKKPRSLSGEVRVCLSPRVFLPRPPRGRCRVCPWTGRLEGWGKEGGGGAASRNTARFRLGSRFMQPQPKPFLCASWAAGGSECHSPSRDSDFWVELFWWWRGGSGVYSRGAATLLTYTLFYNLSSSEREENMRPGSKGSRDRGRNGENRITCQRSIYPATHEW